MAGTVVTTEVTYPSTKKVKFAWTSDASGDADGSTTAVFSGKIVQVTTVPSGVAAPTDNYDVEVRDADGVDLLAGAGANRDEANTEHITSASVGAVCASALTLVVSNAGNATQGTVYVYIE